MQAVKYICADCKGITTGRAGKQGAGVFKTILLNLLIPGITIFMRGRKAKAPKYCSYCGSDFLLPADSHHTNNLLDSINQVGSGRSSQKNNFN